MVFQRWFCECAGGRIQKTAYRAGVVCLRVSRNCNFACLGLNEAGFQRCFLENRLRLTCGVDHDRTDQAASAERIYLKSWDGQMLNWKSKSRTKSRGAYLFGVGAASLRYMSIRDAPLFVMHAWDYMHTYEQMYIYTHTHTVTPFPNIISARPHRAGTTPQHVQPRTPASGAIASHAWPCQVVRETFALSRSVLT